MPLVFIKNVWILHDSNDCSFRKIAMKKKEESYLQKVIDEIDEKELDGVH